jgi:hypothetical protein
METEGGRLKGAFRDQKGIAGVSRHFVEPFALLQKSA